MKEINVDVIRRKQRKLRISSEAIADYAGVELNTYYQYLHRREMPTKVIKKVCEILNLKKEEILRWYTL